MKMIVLFLVSLFILTIYGCDLGTSYYVGDYKYPEQDWSTKQNTRALGHKGYDIKYPTSDEIEFYCSICHVIK
jgi:hypothetical protein